MTVLSIHLRLDKSWQFDLREEISHTEQPSYGVAKGQMWENNCEWDV